MQFLRKRDIARTTPGSGQAHGVYTEPSGKRATCRCGWTAESSERGEVHLAVQSHTRSSGS